MGGSFQNTSDKIETFRHPRHFRKRMLCLAGVATLMGLLAVAASLSVGATPGVRFAAAAFCALMLAGALCCLCRARAAESLFTLSETGITRTSRRGSTAIGWDEIGEIRSGKRSIVLSIRARDTGKVIAVEKSLENLNRLIDRILDRAPPKVTTAVRKKVFGFPRREVIGFILGLALTIGLLWLLIGTAHFVPNQLALLPATLAIALIITWRRLRALVIGVDGIVVRTPLRAIGVPFADVRDLGMTDFRLRFLCRPQRNTAYVVRPSDSRLVLAHDARAFPVYASVRHAWLAAGGNITDDDITLPDYSPVLPHTPRH